MKKLIKSFGYAFSGLWACIIYERNFRIHISAALAVFVFAWLYGVDNVHLAVLVLTVALVFITEAVNTSIEKAVDFYRLKDRKLPKSPKTRRLELFCFRQ